MTNHLAGKALTVDRSAWPRGPWDQESDREDWTTKAGLPAIALRQDSGHWCGYVGVRRGHPVTRFDADEVVLVHGGFTYGPSPCAGHVCHIAKPGEPDDLLWYGFDFAHHRDAYPRRRLSNDLEWKKGVAFYRHDARYPSLSGTIYGTYRTIAYVRRECERVAAAFVRPILQIESLGG